MIKVVLKRKRSRVQALHRFVCIVVLLLLTSAPIAAKFRLGDAASVDMSPVALDRVSQLLASQIRDGSLGAASILVARRSTIVLNRGYGYISPGVHAPEINPDSVYMIASITKAVTATALMLLVDRGKISLNEPVVTYLSEFNGSARSNIRVVDLLAHTSGLPDALPETADLIKARSPLTEYVSHAYTTPLLFKPGTEFRYQSMGFLLAGTIVEKISGMRLREFFRKEIFERLGMRHSSLGLGGTSITDTVQVQQPDTTTLDLNSVYWRNLETPWGGMHSTTMDLAILLQTFLEGGTFDGRRLLSPAAAKSMISDHNGHLNAPWGLGWRLAKSHGMAFGDLVSSRAFGHLGGSGTLAWADPATDLICVILTNRPSSVDRGLLLRLVSNGVAAAVEK